VQRPLAKAVALALSLTAHGVAIGAFFLPRPAAPAQAPTDATTPPEPRGLEGDSFEIPAPNAEADDLPASPGGASAGAPEPPRAPQAPAHAARAPAAEGDAPPKTAAGGPKGAHDAPRGGDEGGEAGEGPKLYGAAGDRSAVDLATAVTRGFPQAASADPAWATVPMGPGGEATLLLTLDETGKLVSSEVLGSPSPALAEGIRRTLALVRGRAFTARGRVTKLHLSATISPDTVHDGLHGDVFAIGGSYTGNEGQAFFALAIGRRVDLRVRPR
jgi:hypothetical protein